MLYYVEAVLGFFPNGFMPVPIPSMCVPTYSMYLSAKPPFMHVE